MICGFFFPGLLPVLAQAAPPTMEGYRIGGLLGQGGFASVYRAVEIATGRPVALKLIDKQLMRASGSTERVRSEARVVALVLPTTHRLYTHNDDDGVVVPHACSPPPPSTITPHACSLWTQSTARV
jgi:serine/threonine protein kinase